MILTILVIVVVHGWPSAEQVAEGRRLRNEALVQRALQGRVAHQQEIDREYMASVRRSIAFMERSIKLDEWQLKEIPEVFSLAERLRFPVDLAQRQIRIEKQKKWLAGLEWAAEERNARPGRDTERLVRKRIDELYEELWPKSVAPEPWYVKP